ncbi:hypothetical protein LPB79_13300 [Rhizobium sp. T136]|uniref:hypothetical protein n=1 Tax=Rhizobium sp. T136 TaxID=555319 RepID=UPI001E47E048|nr:hypothetical protein [Rhizobium sp. T136]UFS83223.1 hypothetical protein LPB79_13300 [Rhizobium sp. T136]
MEETMVERVGAELRRECLEVFGATWSNDVAWRFARAAIKAMREPSEAMVEAGNLPVWDDSVTVGLSEEIWPAMIDAALEEQEKVG